MNKSEILSTEGTISIKACLKEVTVNGYYRFKTCVAVTDKWIISGAIKINRILSNTEVERLCIAHGFIPLPRYDGKFKTYKYDFETNQNKMAI